MLDTLFEQPKEKCFIHLHWVTVLEVVTVGTDPVDERKLNDIVRTLTKKKRLEQRIKVRISSV